MYYSFFVILRSVTECRPSYDRLTARHFFSTRETHRNRTGGAAGAESYNGHATAETARLFADRRHWRQLARQAGSSSRKRSVTETPGCRNPRLGRPRQTGW